jgi:hypothetical protein
MSKQYRSMWTKTSLIFHIQPTGSKALIYGRPQSQFSGELFTTLASALPGRADGAAEPVEPLAAQKRTGGFALAPETIPCAFLGRNKHRRGRRTGEKKA